MFQARAFIELAKILKEHNINIWCYTGFTWEKLISMPMCKELLEYIDVLVDGRFEEDKHSYDLQYRGSSNQRIIDVKKSLEVGEIITIDL
jgi:anaerobic ribonucleoside-triphosphate reductase activating protein